MDFSTLIAGPAQAGSSPLQAPGAGPMAGAGVAPAPGAGAPAEGLDFASLVGLALGRCEVLAPDAVVAAETPATHASAGRVVEETDGEADSEETPSTLDAPVDAMTLSVLLSLSAPIAHTPHEGKLIIPKTLGFEDAAATPIVDACGPASFVPASAPPVAADVATAAPRTGLTATATAAAATLSGDVPVATDSQTFAAALDAALPSVDAVEGAASDAAADAPVGASAPAADRASTAQAASIPADAAAAATAAAPAAATATPAGQAITGEAPRAQATPASVEPPATGQAAAATAGPTRPPVRTPTAPLRAALAALSHAAPASPLARTAEPAGTAIAAPGSTTATTVTVSAASAGSPAAPAAVSGDRVETHHAAPTGAATTPVFRASQDASADAGGQSSGDARQPMQPAGRIAATPAGVVELAPPPAAGSTAATGAVELPMATLGTLATEPVLRAIEFAPPSRFESTLAALDPDTQNLQAMVRTIRLFAGAAGVSEARLSLAPDHLGPVGLTVRVEQGSVSAHFRAETPAAQRWIETHQQELRAGLREQGLEVKEVVVTTDPDGRRERRQDQPVPRQARARRAAGDPDAPRFEVHV